MAKGGRLPSETPRKLVTRSRATTDPRFGKTPAERSVEEHIRFGVVNLDKPSGPTSHEVAAWVKKLLRVAKVGHGGTLDPRVTGILPVALEESTKIAQTLLPAGKEYIGILRLHEAVPEKRVREVFKEFEGDILQRPPVKSAVKRQLRARRIYYLQPLEMEERDVLFKAGCEAGTYVRKLCHDLGAILGCGGHMQELRRTKSGSFTERNIVSLHDLIDAYAFWKEDGEEGPIRRAIVSVEEAVAYLPKIIIRDSAVDSLCHGADLAVPGISRLDADINPKDLVATMTLKGELVAIGEARMDTKGMLIEDAGIAAKTQRVVMRPGVYAKMWKTGKDGGQR